MKTIKQFIDLHNLVFKGKSIILNGSKISSNGMNWLVNDCPIDTIDNKRKMIASIIEKCELVKELLRDTGVKINNMYDEFQIIYDNFDGMILLFKNSSHQLSFIYIVSTHIVIEQIDKYSKTMKYNYFQLAAEEVKHKLLEGKLSLKSKQLLAKLKDEDINITQNFFYDMLFEETISYQELLNQSIIDNQIISPNETIEKICKKLLKKN